jgi:hypothetical protein
MKDETPSLSPPCALRKGERDSVRLERGCITSGAQRNAVTGGHGHPAHAVPVNDQAPTGLRTKAQGWRGDVGFQCLPWVINDCHINPNGVAPCAARRNPVGVVGPLMIAAPLGLKPEVPCQEDK